MDDRDAMWEEACRSSGAGRLLLRLDDPRSPARLSVHAAMVDEGLVALEVDATGGFSKVTFSGDAAIVDPDAGAFVAGEVGEGVETVSVVVDGTEHETQIENGVFGAFVPDAVDRPMVIVRASAGGERRSTLPA